MEENTRIKLLLEQFKNDKKILNELCKYGRKAFIVAVKEKMYDILPLLVTPMEIMVNNELLVRQCCDIFEIDIQDILNNSFDSELKAKESAIEDYEWNKENDFQSDSRSIQEIIDSKIIIPNKKEIYETALNPDFDLVNRMKVKDCPNIFNNAAISISNEKDVLMVSELPTYYACLNFFRKNIVTTQCDFDPNENFARVWISHKYLSEDNRDIAKFLLEKNIAHKADGDSPNIVIEVNCNPDDTVYDMKLRFDEIINKFNIQDNLHESCTFDEIIEFNRKYCSAEIEFKDGFTIENVIKYYIRENASNYFDFNEGRVWNTREAYDRHINYLNSILSEKSMKV